MRALAAAALVVLGCTPLKGADERGAIPIATGQSTPDALAISTDGTTLFWSNRGTGSSDGSIWKMVLPNSAPTMVAGAEAQPASLIAAGAFIYWVNSVDSPDGAIRRAPVDGSTPPATLASQVHKPVAIAVDATPTVYYATIGDGGIIWMLLKNTSGGLSPFQFVGGVQDTPVAMSVDATGLYWLNGGNFTDSGALLKRELGPLVAPGNLLASGLKNPRALVAAAGSLLWANAATTTDAGTVQELVRGSDRPIVLATGQQAPVALALDGDGLLWATAAHDEIGCGVRDGVVRRVQVTGGAGPVEQLATGGFGRPTALLVDGKTLFVADQGCDPSSGGVIYRFDR